MGSGKTAIGKRLAEKLNLQFIDMDVFIENRFHKSVSAIFEEKGEAAFRKIERTILLEIIEFENIVISTGGGTPCFFDNMDLMNRAGITIYLKMSGDELAKRLQTGKQKRPLIKDKNSEEMKTYIAENLVKREQFYNRATLIIENDDIFSKENCTEQIKRLIENIES
jgi:shikimate kinase